ncbi:MAG TPA: SMP-30/gluconolactonase/LRE family protein [Phenylobacterium sp.]|nr:SMP-30/gluconolactonase/LRE family protein [Phenylobacterium sp.]
MTTIGLRAIYQGGDILGEGPLWSPADRRLYWFDIQGRKLRWVHHDGGSPGHLDLPMRASAAATRTSGGLILATELGLYACDPLAGSLAPLVPMTFPEGFRTNDGKIDVRGRFWWSTMDDDHGARPGGLFRTDPDLSTRQVLDDLHIANTVSCSPDGATLYVADSRRATLYAHDISADGQLGPRRVFAQTQGGPGVPDGSAVDAQGFLWNAQWGAARIVRYAPDGSIDRVVAAPVAQPSSCAFGGPDLATLYVTSARQGLSPADLAAQPLAGSLFAFEPGVTGLPLPAFAG